MAADYTTVSLTPGKDETELNFAWYSEKTDAEATPVVHFGTDQDALETFTGTSGDVNQELTGDTAYTYNHVTVTGLEPNTNLLLYGRKKWGADRSMRVHHPEHGYGKNPVCR